MIYREEHLYCLLDRGQIKSSGRFVTRLDETIEFGLCHFDACISGFRWNEDYGWEPIFLQEFHTSDRTSSIKICTYTEDNPYTEEEIAFELDCYFALKHSQGLL